MSTGEHAVIGGPRVYIPPQHRLGYIELSAQLFQHITRNLRPTADSLPRIRQRLKFASNVRIVRIDACRPKQCAILTLRGTPEGWLDAAWDGKNFILRPGQKPRCGCDVHQAAGALLPLTMAEAREMAERMNREIAAGKKVEL